MSDDVLPGFRKESVVEDGIEYEVRVYRLNGDRYWYLNGVYHRVQGPAVDRVNGHKSWYLNGKCHREDGPSILGVVQQAGSPR